MTAACSHCGRLPKERKPRCIRCADTARGRLLPSALPGRLLCVDPGKTSGWCIIDAHSLTGVMPRPPEFCAFQYGECDVWGPGPDTVCDIARVEDCEALVLECPGLGGSMTPAVTYGLGRAAGCWERAWRLSKRQGDRSVVVEIPAMTWRASIIGGPQRPTDEWKAAALAHCKRTWPREYITGNETPDAVCLGEHALHSLDVADAVGPQRLKALRWREPRGYWREGAWVSA